jgi:hypothetical protein
VTDAEAARQPVIDIAAMLGGRRGVVDATTPGVVLVIVDVFAPLGWAIGAAVAAAVLLASARFLRHEPLRQVIMGLPGIALAATLAAVTGDAKTYFLPGILINAAYAVAAAVSIGVRRPLLGYVAALVDSGYGHWQGHPPLRRAATMATALWMVMFALRAAVQGYLYTHNDVHLLAPARLAMGLPLWVLTVTGTLLVLEGHRRPVEDSPAGGVADPQTG